MRLSRIKLAGFKSFVDPTSIELPGKLVGIVGPNGCGKSNTIDAVRWVMGESSAKHLRGDSMEDVIFNGSSSRKPVGQASIELVFDNSASTLGGQYAQYSEIAIKRRVGRDGQSQYFLNGTRCRRRDITDIFLGTGLGPRSYAIIEQGMISRLIEARPEDLRLYLEEAAGISRYRERRRETESRISQTRENLERLQDVRDEVEKQIRHLGRQAELADRYRKLRDEERRLKAELVALRLRELDRDLERRKRDLHEHETQLEHVVAQQRSLEAELEQDRTGLGLANEHLNEVQGRFYRLGSDIATTEQSIRHQRELSQRQGREMQQRQQSLADMERQMQADEQRLEQMLQSLEELEPRHAAGIRALEALDARLHEAERAMSDWQARWDAFNRDAAEPAQAVKVERARIDYLGQQLKALETRAGRLQDEVNTLSMEPVEGEIQELESRLEGAKLEEDSLKDRLRQVQAAIQSHRELSRSLAAELDAWRAESQVKSGRLASLEALQQAALGREQKSVGRWLQAQGMHQAPRLGELLEVAEGWETALETVLGPYLEAVCVDALEALVQASGSLSEGQMTAFAACGKGQSAGSGSGTWLADHVQCPHDLGDLLAGIRVARSLNEALETQSHLGVGESVITPQGIWLGRRWMRIVRSKDGSPGLLAREKELRGLRSDLEALRAAVAERSGVLDERRALLTRLEAERDQAQEAVNRGHRSLADLQSRLQACRSHLQQMQSRRNRVSEELADIQATRDSETRALGEATQRHDQALGAMEDLAIARHALEAERDSLRELLIRCRSETQERRDDVHRMALQAQSLKTSRDATQQGLARLDLQRQQLITQLSSLAETIEAAAAPLEDLEKALQEQLLRRTELERELGSARQGVQALEERLREKEHARVQREQEAGKLREGLEGLRMAWHEASVRRQTGLEQLQEMKFQLEALLQDLDVDASIDAWQAQIEKLSQRIQKLGPINLAAIDEFREQSERKAYLDAQHADLVAALDTLEVAMQRIDRETRARFRATFERVNLRMGEMFPRLFGGGQAHLEMTGDDLLTTGVAVMARPPGKRLSTIHLMSGGEKALTAVALVFAIFELNPAPFCMLDEVDAPLDEANVGRFCDLVRDMSQRVQFIFITHNKTTMEMADHLIGVTMREPGVSRLVSVDVEQAAQMAGA